MKRIVFLLLFLTFFNTSYSQINPKGVNYLFDVSDFDSNLSFLLDKTLIEKEIQTAIKDNGYILDDSHPKYIVVVGISLINYKNSSPYILALSLIILNMTDEGGMEISPNYTPSIMGNDKKNFTNIQVNLIKYIKNKIYDIKTTFTN